MGGSGAKRLYENCGALLGVAALALQLYLLIATAIPLGRTVPGAVVQFFSYFTILSNILVVLSYLGPRRGGFFARPSVQSAIALYITAVGLVYVVVLRPLWSPEGWALVADAALHYAAPLLYFIYWLAFVPMDEVRYGAVARWLVFPILFCVYALARGAASGLYPYPFLEADKLGYVRVTGNIAVLIVILSLFGLLMIVGGRARYRGQKRRERSYP